MHDSGVSTQTVNSVFLEIVLLQGSWGSYKLQELSINTKK